MTTGKRFKVALSFPGEKREFVEQVAEHLVDEFGKSNVFYDNYYEDELARPNLDIYLMNIYKDHSELVVLFLCEEYDKKEWCGVEWRAVRDMIKKKKDDEVMPFRFDMFEIDGALSIDGFVNLKDKTPRQVSELIIKRINKTKSPVVTGTVSDLQNIEKQIADLKATIQNQIAPLEFNQQLEHLTKERDALREQLLQTEEIAEQHRKIKEDLEQSLAKQKETEELKKKALQAIEEEDYDTAEELLKEATKDAIAEAAEGFYQLGNIKELKLEYRTALEYYEMAVKASPDNREYLKKAGRLSRELGYLDNAIHYLQKAIEACEETNAHRDLTGLYNEIGLVWDSKGDYDLAIQYYTLSLVIDKEMYGESHPAIAIGYNNIGSAWSSKGIYDKAIDYFGLALAIDKQHYGESHPSVATSYNNLGMVWKRKGEYDTAIEYFNQTLVILKENYGETHPHIASSYNNLGMAWRYKGKFDKAIDYFGQARKIHNLYYGETHPYIATNCNNIGGVWDSKGEFDRAIEYYNEALAILKKHYGETHPHIASTYNNLGLSWYSKGDYDMAISFHQQALEIDKLYYGESHPDLATDYNNLGIALNSKGEFDKAINLFEMAIAMLLGFHDEAHPDIKNIRQNLALCIAERDKKQTP